MSFSTILYFSRRDERLEIFSASCSSTNFVSDNSFFSFAMVDSVGLIANIPKKDKDTKEKIMLEYFCVFSFFKSGKYSKYLFFFIFVKTLPMLYFETFILPLIKICRDAHSNKSIG